MTGFQKNSYTGRGYGPAIVPIWNGFFRHFDHVVLIAFLRPRASPYSSRKHIKLKKNMDLTPAIRVKVQEKTDREATFYGSGPTEVSVKYRFFDHEGLQLARFASYQDD